MKNLIIGSIFAIATVAPNAVSADTITISGTITDKEGQPVSKCDVFFNKEAWITEDSVHVQCDKNGRYSAEIKAGHYNSFYVCDEEEYGKTALEFWGWNLNFTKSQTLDAAFDTLEVYSLSTWASNGGSNSIFGSFRPMSLKKPVYRNLELNGKTVTVMDITPAVDMHSIAGSIDDTPLKLVNYNWTYEKVANCSSAPDDISIENGCYMPMIIAQFEKPQMVAGQHTFKIRLTDAETGNIGEGITHFTSNSKNLGF